MTTRARRPVTADPIRRRPRVDPRALSVALATAYLEVRAGRRPPAQLDPVLAPSVQRQLGALVRRTRGQRQEAGAYSLRRAVLQQVHDATEAAIVLEDRGRVLVVAVRLERRGDGWVVTALGSPEDQMTAQRRARTADGAVRPRGTSRRGRGAAQRRARTADGAVRPRGTS